MFVYTVVWVSALSTYTDIFIVGFVETMYTVIEGAGQVEVCVTLTSPEGDIGNERILLEVFNNADPFSIPADVAAASTLVLCVLLNYSNSYIWV